ncbi:hypothetical protein [Anaerotignum sp.]|uniref:hypothetical protein n=1 Tax=Anaerotignum sp. TaxID=2039241 RepID=UPI003A8A26C9
MKFTENFNLNLPDLDDIADVEKMNENFQTIDTTMKSLETDPELAANVVDIKNKIGTEADADTQPTLFGRLAQLKNVLVEKLAEVLTKVTGIDGKIGTSGDEAGTATLFGQVSSTMKAIEGKIMYTPSDNVKKTLISTEYSVPTINGGIYLGSFFAEKSGVVKVSANLKYDNAEYFCSINMIQALDILPIVYNSRTVRLWPTNVKFIPSIGDTVQNNTMADGTYSFMNAVLESTSQQYKLEEATAPVRKGEIYYFFLAQGSYRKSAGYCNSLTISYDEQEVS